MTLQTVAVFSSLFSQVYLNMRVLPSLLIACLLLHCFSWTNSYKLTRFLRLPYSRHRQSLLNLKALPKKSPSFISVSSQVRGGSTGDLYTSVSLPPLLHRRREGGQMTILVTSNFGASPYLRKAQKFSVFRNESVVRLKEVLEKKFPGQPPVSLQTLYVDSKTLLRDDDVWGNLTNKQALSVQLDLLSGTALYNRTPSLSISKAIDAYISLSVHEAYLSNKLTEELTSSPPLQTPDSVRYRDLYKKLNESFYLEFGPAVREAQEAERDPSLVETSVEEPPQEISSLTPLPSFLREQVMLSDRDMTRFTYWSTAFMVYALLGTESRATSLLSVAAIPVLWATSLRTFRLCFKVLRNFVVSLFSNLEVLLRFLPAPLQAIACESGRWRSGVQEGNGEFDHDEVDPVMELRMRAEGAASYLRGAMYRLLNVSTDYESAGGDDVEDLGEGGGEGDGGLSSE